MKIKNKKKLSVILMTIFFFIFDVEHWLYYCVWNVLYK